MARKPKPHQILIDWLFAYVLAPFFAIVLHVLCFTLRWDIRGRENLKPFWDDGRPVFVACWHGRLILIPYAWWKVGRGVVHVLMGRNRNGELITRIVKTFNMDSIRGGSRSGGEEARKQMAEAVRNSSRATLALTPDGPHGPRYESKMGMAQMSKNMGVPVIWVSAVASHAVRINMWDRFLFPLPFSRVIVSFGPATYPEAHAALSVESYRDMLDNIGKAALLAVDTEMGVLSAEDKALLVARELPAEPDERLAKTAG